MSGNESLKSNPPPIPCRLCGGESRYAFSLLVLQKYDVGYSRCAHCDSLQTERPRWLHEAYSTNLSLLDTGAAQRNLSNLAAVYAAAKVLHFKNVVDFGGGDGLLCRLLRDYGINCFVNDKYASATYSRGFAVPNFTVPQIVLAFEVLEHFEDPSSELKALFESTPSAILGSTALYSGQGADWWYLTPETGQHVFFYSGKALRMIAKSYDYALLTFSGYFLMLRPGVAPAVKRQLIRVLLHRYVLRLVSAGMRLLPAPGVQSDFNNLRREAPAGKPNG